MRQVAIFLTFAAASMAGKIFTSAIDSLSWPILTGIALTMFSGFFIFTVMTAKSPVQIQWKPSIRISPEVMEHLKNAMNLMAVMILFAATAVILIALAATGPEQSFPESLINVVKCLPKVLDV